MTTAPPLPRSRPTAPPTRPAAVTFALPTFVGALSVVGGATALTPLVDGLSWMVPVIEVIGLMWLIGVGTRLLALPTWATQAAQAISLVLAVTGLHLTHGIGGVIPGPAAIREAGAVLDTAWSEILTTVPPMPASPNLELVLTSVLGLVALAVDLMIASSRTPALVALPLLALYSVPASIADELLPWYAFALPAVAFVAVLATSASATGRTPRGVDRGRLITTASMAIVAIAGSLLAANLADSVGTVGRIPHAGKPAAEVGLDPWVSLRGELTEREPTDVMRVSGLTSAAYLRTVALETYLPGEGFGPGPMTADAVDVNGALPWNRVGADRADATVETVTITPLFFRDRYLPLYLNTTAVAGTQPGWSYDDNLRVAFKASPTTPLPYEVTVDTATATVAELRQQHAVGGDGLTDTGDLPPTVRQLAARLTADATTDFDRVNALLRYFLNPANGFQYSLATEPGTSGDALQDFLTNKSGYCEQYAAAMAAMVRSLGIPARVAIGFTQGNLVADGLYQVVSDNAHAWVEVPFSDSGWIIFDPTPPVDGQGGLQGFTTGPSSDSKNGNGPTSSTPPPSTASTTPSLHAPTPSAQALPSSQPDGTAPSSAGGDESAGHLLRVAAMVVAALAAFAAVLLLPRAVRAGRRRRRLRAARSGDAVAAWQEILDTMTDHRLPISPAESARTIANEVAHQGRLSASERTALRAIVEEVERNWYGSLAASGRTVTTTATADARPGALAVIAGLRRSVPVSAIGRWWPASLHRRQAR